MLRNLDKPLFLAVILIFISNGLIAHSNLESSSVMFKEEWCQKEQSETQEDALYVKKESELMKNTIICIYTGYYDIRDDRFKSIYTGRGHVWSLGVSRRVFTLSQHQIFIFLDFRFFSKKGKSTFFKEDTKFLHRPISLGGAYLFVTEIIIPFAELGVDYHFYREESTLHTTSGSALGFHGQCGMFIPLPGIESLQLKLYMRYSRAETTKNELKAELGGFEYGIGLAFGFNI
ncbi:MAG: hypothetical protein ACETWK_05305 [Candidatus Aminicenantaceae bacterium]